MSINWRCKSGCRYKKKNPDAAVAKSPKAKATNAKKETKPAKKAAVKEAPKILSEDDDDMEEGKLLLPSICILSSHWHQIDCLKCIARGRVQEGWLHQRVRG